MLKACWDCLVGDGTRGEEPYGTQLNGNVRRAPPWPTPQMENETIYILPKPLNYGDEIAVHGKILNGSQFIIGLLAGSDNFGAGSSPDNNNVACQLLVDFIEDRIKIQTIQNGEKDSNEDYNVSDNFVGKNREIFKIRFQMRTEELKMNVYIEDSHLETVPLRHDVNNIRFLSLTGGKMETLQFNFK